MISSVSRAMISMLIGLVIGGGLWVFFQDANAKEIATNVDVEKLPLPHLKLGNKMASETVTVIIDPRCKHCKKLYDNMKDDKKTKYNVYLNPFGSNNEVVDEYVQAIYCADDRKFAIDNAFNQQHIDASSQCELEDMYVLQEFMKSNGLIGTPIGILSNGDVRLGYTIKNGLL